MRPLANFSCKNCGKLKGEEPVKIEDLPIDSVRCPYCGKKRGFQRLFDGIGGIMKGKTRNMDRLITDTLESTYEKVNAQRDGARSFEKAANEAIDRSIHEASPQERATAKTFQPHIMPAAQALGSIPRQARQDSRELVYPALTNKKVVPQWEK